MHPIIKIFLFVTAPLWVVPCLIVGFLIGWYYRFSEFIDDLK